MGESIERHRTVGRDKTRSRDGKGGIGQVRKMQGKARIRNREGHGNKEEEEERIERSKGKYGRKGREKGW